MLPKHPNIIFLSGASGVGKTTIVNALRGCFQSPLVGNKTF